MNNGLVTADTLREMIEVRRPKGGETIHKIDLSRQFKDFFDKLT